MLESLTLLTVLSAAPAALKFAYDAVDFYSKAKALRSSAPPRPLAQSDTLPRFERTELSKMYAAIERCRPVAADISQRALRFYLFVAGAVTALLILLSILALLLLPIEWLSGACAVIAVGGTAVIWSLRGPMPKALLLGNREDLWRYADDFLRPLEAALRDARSATRVSLRAAGISIPERAFLNTYIEADALVRVLECHQLTNELRSGISTAHETLTGRVFETAAKIIEDLAKGGQLDDPAQRSKVLTGAFRSVGLGDLVNPELVGDNFFEVDFRSLQKDMLRKYLEKYLSFKPRR